MSDPTSFGSSAHDGASDPGLNVDAHGGAFWRRSLYMVGYGFIAYFVLMALFIVAVTQAVYTLVSGHRSHEIGALARNLTVYLTELVAFVSWASDEKPFPAGRFPDEQ